MVKPNLRIGSEVKDNFGVGKCSFHFSRVLAITFDKRHTQV